VAIKDYFDDHYFLNKKLVYVPIQKWTENYWISNLKLFTPVVPSILTI
jgi:hypothetical protein